MVHRRCRRQALTHLVGFPLLVVSLATLTSRRLLVPSCHCSPGYGLGDERNHLLCCSTSLFLPLTPHPKHGTPYPVASMSMQCLVASVRRDARSGGYSLQ